jgi:hypothetical protein
VRARVVTDAIRPGALTSSPEAALGWQLVTRVFGGQEARKPANRVPPVMPLRFRCGPGGPIDRGSGDDMGIATRQSQAGDVPSVALRRVKGKPHGPAQRQRRVNGLPSHEGTSGQALPTGCRRGGSPWAARVVGSMEAWRRSAPREGRATP